MEKIVEVGGPDGFVVRKIIVGPITENCSAFIDPAEGDWAVGDFVKNNLIVPPVTFNFSEAEPPPTEPKE